MITIDYQNTAPIYEQIVEKFQMLIIKGILPPGSKMPSVRSLAVQLSINPNTIQKAYAVLEHQGYVFSIKGRGSFVADTENFLIQKRNSCMRDLEEKLRQAKELGITEDIVYELTSQAFSAAASGTGNGKKNTGEKLYD